MWNLYFSYKILLSSFLSVYLFLFFLFRFFFNYFFFPIETLLFLHFEPFLSTHLSMNVLFHCVLYSRLTLPCICHKFSSPGTFGKNKYVYYGRHSEGNRFIRNRDLWDYLTYLDFKQSFYYFCLNNFLSLLFVSNMKFILFFLEKFVMLKQLAMLILLWVHIILSAKGEVNI